MRGMGVDSSQGDRSLCGGGGSQKMCHISEG